MPFSNDYARVACTSIRVDPSRRQRKSFTTEDLEPSIQRRGVMNPIIVDRNLVLLAGERRLTASLKLGLPDIPIRYADELSETERRMIQLEENIKRVQLHWRDEAKAYGDLHSIMCQDHEGWTTEQTGEEIGVSKATVNRFLRIFRELDSPKIANCKNESEAYNILLRNDERKLGNVMADIIDAGADLFSDPTPIPQAPLPSTTAPHLPPMPMPPIRKGIIPAQEGQKRSTAFPNSILHGDFIEWAKTYEGPKFNFIHCDFPYGIDLFAAEQSGKNRQTTYNDDEAVYWKLIEEFCKYRNRFMSHSAHVMFWFSMDYYTETLDMFRQLAPELEFQKHPLYWTKTDNVGILNDPRRTARRIVETALIASRDDRFIVQGKSNWYGCPTDKKWHTSTKPEPMLRHFFTMFVDEHTRMLDPTCGSGAALRAAESLNAHSVFGIERDFESYTNAQQALRDFRLKAAGSKLVEDA